MVLIGSEYHDKLLVNHVDDLRDCGLKDPRTTFLRLRMAHTLRLLVTEGQGNRLAFRVAERYQTPLWVLVPEPISGNTPREEIADVPENVKAYATLISEATHPTGSRGYYHKPYAMTDYLDLPLGVLMHHPINPTEVIKFLANKMGGSHADDELLDGGRGPDAETLQFLNENISIFGEGAIYRLFDNAAAMIWKSLAPLRDEVAASYDNRIAL